MAKTFAPTAGSRDNFNSLFERLSDCEAYLRLMYNELVHAEYDITYLTDRVATLEANYTAIASQQSEINYAVNTGVKNLLHFNAIGSGIINYGTTYTHNGITYKLNADMTVTATGTADNNSYAYLILDGSFAPIDELCDGKHILSGCPVGGSTSTFRMYMTKSGWGNLIETGRGVIIPDANGYSGILVACFVSKDYAIPASEPLVFKPMIRPAEITDSTYVPYAPTNRELYEMIQALQSGGASTQSVQPALMSAAAEREEDDTDA